MNNAKKIADEQRAADKAHHEKRVRWLSQDRPVWACGTPVSPGDKYNFLKRSLTILATEDWKNFLNSCHCTPRCS